MRWINNGISLNGAEKNIEMLLTDKRCHYFDNTNFLKYKTLN